MNFLNTSIKDYHIKSELGQGGMATVFLAHDNKFDTEVAIKLLRKEFVLNENIRKRFIAEARNMFKMSHPNIIKVTDLIEEGDTVAFVMEYVEGETLKQYIDRKGKLSNGEINVLFTQMLDAVGYVHEQKLVHRDIKPSNFMVDKNGKVKLMDFGIAKTLDPSSVEYTITGTYQSMGTPLYMSPEQIKSTKAVTLQSDIYSLGVVLWNMVTGKKPYDAESSSIFDLHTKIVNEKLPATSSIFDIVIDKSTAKNLDERFKNCGEFKNNLENLSKEDNENTKSYTLQNSEKTIIETAADKTIVEKTKQPETLSPPDIKIPYNSPVQNSSNNIIFIVLGIILIIGLGIAITNKSDQYDADATPSEDTTVMAIDSAAVVIKNKTEKSNTTNSWEDLLLGTRTFGTHWIEPYGSVEITKIGSDIWISGEQLKGDEYCKIEGYITLIDNRNFIFKGMIAVRHHTTDYDRNTGTFSPITEDKVLNGEYKFRRIGSRRFWRLKQPDTSTGYFEYSYHYIDIFMD